MAEAIKLLDYEGLAYLREKLRLYINQQFARGYDVVETTDASLAVSPNTVYTGLDFKDFDELNITAIPDADTEEGMLPSYISIKHTVNADYTADNKKIVIPDDAIMLGDPKLFNTGAVVAVHNGVVTVSPCDEYIPVRVTTSTNSYSIGTGFNNQASFESPYWLMMSISGGIMMSSSTSFSLTFALLDDEDNELYSYSETAENKNGTYYLTMSVPYDAQAISNYKYATITQGS